MATRQKIAEITGNEEDDVQGEFTVIETDPAILAAIDEEERSDIEYQTFLKDINAIGDSGTVKVYKLIKDAFRDQIMLFECSPAEFKETLLANPDYHEDGYHSFRVVGRSRTGIVTAKTIKVFPQKDFKKPGEATNASQDMSAIIAPIMAVIAAASENTNKILAAMAEQNKPAPQKTTLDMLQEMAAMKNLLHTDAPKQADPMEMIRNSMELAKLITPPEGGASGMDAIMKALDTFGKPIAEAVSHMSDNAQAAQPVRIAAPQMGSNIPSPAQTPTKPVTITDQSGVPENEDDEVTFMKSIMKTVVRAAKGNADPSLYAELVLDNFGEEIGSYMDAPNWFEMLCTIEPTVAAHRAWFEDLRTEIKNQLTESPDTGNVIESDPRVIDVSPSANASKGNATGNS